MHLVIVGNGIAGIEAALAARARRDDLEITIVSEESDHLFSRTALMYVLAGQLRVVDIEPHERDLYARARFTRVRARATAVDVAGHALALDDGRRLAYDRLLLAVGSRPRTLGVEGEDLAGVGHFVTLADLAWLEGELTGRGIPGLDVRKGPAGSPYAARPALAAQRGRRASRVAVVGGGLIGIEAVECALHAGASVDFFVREEWYWPMALCARESAWIADRLRAHGCRVHLETTVAAFERGPDGGVSAVRASDGTHAADAVVVAVGVRPNTDWLDASGLARDAHGALIVDEHLRTSAPDVLAAGDCASIEGPDGARRPLQLWYTARDQGRVAGASLVDDRAPGYARGLEYNSAKLADVEFTTVGRLNVPGAREWIHEETGRVRSLVRVVEVGGRAVGVNVLGRRVDHEVLLRFLGDGLCARDLVACFASSAFDTELVPPLVIPEAVWPSAPEAAS